MLQGEPTDLRLHLLDVGSRRSISLLAKSFSAALTALSFPNRHLIGMNLKLLRNFRNRFVTLKSGKSHFGLEGC
jgi:hypothetical protein